MAKKPQDARHTNWTWLPPGEAEHAHDLNGKVTARPKRGHPQLFHGQGRPNFFIKGKVNCIGLFTAECVVFMKEMTPYIRAQLILDAMAENEKQERATKVRKQLRKKEDREHLSTLMT